MAWYHEASEKVMPSPEHNPWESFPKDLDAVVPLLEPKDISPCPCPDDRCKLTKGDPRHGTMTGYVYHKCKCRPCRDTSAQYQRKYEKNNNIKQFDPVTPNVDQQNVMTSNPVDSIHNDVDDPRHGTIRGYDIGCRCDPCKSAKNDYKKEYNKNKLEEIQQDPEHSFHGTIQGYNIGCRCDPCKSAKNDYKKEYNKNKLEEIQQDPEHSFHGTIQGYDIGCRCDPCKSAKNEYMRQQRRKKKESSIAWYEAAKEEMMPKEELWNSSDQMIMTAAQIEKKIQDVFDIRQKGQQWHYEQARTHYGISHNQFMEASKAAGHKTRGAFGGGWSGQLNLNHYMEGLWVGATHRELMDVVNNGYKLQGYNNARRGYGDTIKANHREVMEALGKRIPITLYGQARRNGATHKEVLDAKKQKVNIGNYSLYRAYDVDHQKSIEGLKAKITPHNYKYGLRGNLTHDDMINLSQKKVNIDDFAQIKNFPEHSHDSIDDILSFNDKLQSSGSSMHSYINLRRSNATKKEALDVINKKITTNDYTDARGYNFNTITHQEALDAINRGVNPRGYNILRINGKFDHQKTLEISSMLNNDKRKMSEYGVGIGNGCTPKELNEVLNYDDGSNLSLYVRKRDRYNNSSHEQVMKEIFPDYNPWDIVFNKNASKWYLASIEPTDEERNDAHSKDINLHDYGYARQHGATHNELLDMHSKGLNLYDYGYARELGATHNEILDAKSKGLNLYDYGYARQHGATHNEILDMHSKGINLYHYGYARDHGATHNEILDAHSKGINLNDYAQQINLGKSHTESLIKLSPDYSPWNDIFNKNSSKYEDCHFCGGSSHMYHTAAKEINPGVVNTEKGMPRPYVVTKPEQHKMNQSDVDHYKKINPNIQVNDRKLYKKMPVPWYALYVNQNSSLPTPSTDRSTEAADNELCPMCGEGFDQSGLASRVKGSSFKKMPTLIHGILPYHDNCMKLQRAHCPFLSQAPDSFFENGKYSDIRNNFENDYNSVDENYFYSSKLNSNSSKQHLASNEPTNEERNDARAKGIDLDNYGYARDYGVTHNEALDAHSRGLDLFYYVNARALGATHNEALDAHSKGLNIRHYGYARENATHNEILEAHSNGINLHDYAYARGYNVNHNEALDAHSKGIDLHHYANARTVGATHNEILDADSKGIDINDYSYARKHNANHEQALTKLIPNYNPWDDIFNKNSSSWYK